MTKEFKIDKNEHIDFFNQKVLDQHHPFALFQLKKERWFHDYWAIVGQFETLEEAKEKAPDIIAALVTKEQNISKLPFFLDKTPVAPKSEFKSYAETMGSGYFPNA